MTNEEPLIHTSKGNLPVASLKLETAWVDTPDYVQFVERYVLDGEVVKQSVHVLARTGFSMDGQQATF